MKTADFIKYLQEYEPNDHNKPGELCFWDIERECYLELVPQTKGEPGIDHYHYMGCGCVSGFTINFVRTSTQD